MSNVTVVMIFKSSGHSCCVRKSFKSLNTRTQIVNLIIVVSHTVKCLNKWTSIFLRVDVNFISRQQRVKLVKEENEVASARQFLMQR